MLPSEMKKVIHKNKFATFFVYSSKQQLPILYQKKRAGKSAKPHSI
jgi:hypothetical protein